MKKLLLILLLCLVVGCTTTKYIEVPVETIKTEYIDRVQHDSVFVKDSVYIESKHDTVYQYKYKYVYKYINHTDSFCKVDTITKVLPPVEVERIIYKNKLYGWQKILMLFGALTLIILGYALYKNLRND